MSYYTNNVSIADIIHFFNTLINFVHSIVTVGDDVTIFTEIIFKTT